MGLYPTAGHGQHWLVARRLLATLSALAALSGCTSAVPAPLPATEARVSELKVSAATNAVTLPRLVGFVFQDTNGDGVKQTTEAAGLAGVSVSLVPVTSGTSGKGAQTTQTVAPEGWYGLSVAPDTYTLTFALPAGWRATGPLTRTLVMGTVKQMVNLSVQPLAATATPTAAPTPAPSVWRVVPVADDCFDIVNLSDKRTYSLCIASREMFRVTIKPTATTGG